ncbi:MAG TPA: hypothetical protein VGM94_04900 [Galbitalea sp.]|jgi:hypothetical protein
MAETPTARAAGADTPLSASAALKLLDNQQRRVANERGRFVFPITLAWSVAWLVGFLALWSVDGPTADSVGGWHGLPLPVAITIFLVLLVAAIVISIVQGVRGGRGFKGSASEFTGTVYGISWSVTMVAIGILGGALQAHGMSTTVANIYYPCVYTFAVGLLYLLAGAIWHSVPSVVAGGCVILVAVIATWFGYPNHYLVLAIGGGGTFLVLAIHDVVAGRRVRAQLAGEAH